MGPTVDNLQHLPSDFPPQRQGLYDPAHEHDACGLGFIAHIKGKKSHAIIAQGLEILKNLTLHLDNVVFCHAVSSFSWADLRTIQRVGIPPLKFALRSSDSYCCDIT